MKEAEAGEVGREVVQVGGGLAREEGRELVQETQMIVRDLTFLVDTKGAVAPRQDWKGAPAFYFDQRWFALVHFGIYYKSI